MGINTVLLFNALSFLNETSRNKTMSNTKYSNKAYSMGFKAQIINIMKKGESAAKLS